MDSVVSPTSVVPRGLPLAMDRERSRVLVAESLHRAAASANSGSLDAACALLAEAEAMLAGSPSMQQRDPLCARLQEVLGSALRRLEETLDECKCRSGASRLEKPSLPQLAQLGDAMRAEARHPPRPPRPPRPGPPRTHALQSPPRFRPRRPPPAPRPRRGQRAPPAPATRTHAPPPPLLATGPVDVDVDDGRLRRGSARAGARHPSDTQAAHLLGEHAAPLRDVRVRVGLGLGLGLGLALAMLGLGLGLGLALAIPP